MNIMAVFAHPDDELGCIGTLKKHVERGDKVMFVWTTHGELASQFINHSDEEVRRIRHEHGKYVADTVGADFRFFDMGDSRMTGSRDEALQLARLYAEFKPDALMTWSNDHPHPDHRMTAKITFDAITLARIPKIINEDLGEGLPHLEPHLEPHREAVKLYQYVSTGKSNYPIVHVDISEQIETCVQLYTYYADFYKWKNTPEKHRQIKAIRGHEVGVGFAERFELRTAFNPVLEYLA